MATSAAATTNDDEAGRALATVDPLPSCAELARHGDVSWVGHPAATASWARARDALGMRAMHVAASYGHAAFLEALVETGLDREVNRADEDARTPLHWAAWCAEVVGRVGPATDTAPGAGTPPPHRRCWRWARW